FLAVAKDRAGEFDSIDSDHDGVISEAEAYEHLRKTYEANGKPMPAGLFSKLEQGRH
ncbi:TPA: EF-hand domain-containing protein, partial [Pseudomonas aeruginosa]|nr:EF-hand domain-containing protein [Pseudomonas aeruginosa]